MAQGHQTQDSRYDDGAAGHCRGDVHSGGERFLRRLHDLGWDLVGDRECTREAAGKALGDLG